MEYTGSSYVGEMVTDPVRMEGSGVYQFESGTKYVGSLLDGQFHGEGVLHMTTGAKIQGKWKNGKMIEGKLTFEDGLEFKDDEKK